MGTLIEGEVTEILQVTAKVNEIPFEEGTGRVVIQITIDDRRDKNVKIGDKIQSMISNLSRNGAKDE